MQEGKLNTLMTTSTKRRGKEKANMKELVSMQMANVMQLHYDQPCCLLM